MIEIFIGGIEWMIDPELGNTATSSTQNTILFSEALPAMTQEARIEVRKAGVGIR